MKASLKEDIEPYLHRGMVPMTTLLLGSPLRVGLLYDTGLQKNGV